MDDYIDLLSRDARNPQGWLVSESEIDEDIVHVVEEASQENEIPKPRSAKRSI
ncbi:unnamed protein product [Cuscuta epithymum]|uniref:Uncharacterized protein n=1 Tax=Cuscuta epithymum TaxID=186058 RepID=A0AAV0ET15_9ASTE|nr:unnamed protein product [Cuscuta epithymum]